MVTHTFVPFLPWFIRLRNFSSIDSNDVIYGNCAIVSMSPRYNPLNNGMSHFFIYYIPTVLVDARDDTHNQCRLSYDNKHPFYARLHDVRV